MSYDKVTRMKQHLLVGTKQTIRALQKGDLKEVIVAKDASEKVTQEVVEIAEELGIPCTYVDSRKKLGKACGISVSTSTVGIKRH